MKTLPEAELLISCSQEDAYGNLDELKARANAVNDWNELTRLSESHKVTPLVLPFLKKLADDGHVPATAIRNMSDVAKAHVVAHMNQRMALKRLLLALKNYSVPVIVLKGVVLGSLLYQKPETRPSGDIDLLCKEEDFETVHECLESLGYTAENESKLPERHSHDETHFERHYFDLPARLHIELHVDEMKLGLRPKHERSIWDRVISVDIDGTKVLALSLEDQVLTLSVHLHRHGFNRLIWFKDIDLLLRKWHEKLDWDQVIEQADLEGAKPSLWYTFHFLELLLGTPIPEDVMSRLKPNAPIRWAFRMIWPESKVMNLSSKTKRRAVQFSVLESWRGMIPSLLLMGRRREKMSVLLRRKFMY